MARMRSFAIVFLFCWLTPLLGMAEEKLKVVASFSIIGDMVKQIAGEHVDMKVLVGENGNVHEYEPTASDARKIVAADIIFINGLGLEGWVERLIKSSGFKGKVVTVTQGIKPLLVSGHADPHMWQDVEHGKVYAANIRTALIEADKARSQDYKTNGDAYIEKLGELDKWVHEQISHVPPSKRQVISMHDSFRYFTARYGVKFIAPLGGSTESDASAAGLASIIDQIRQQHITAIFLENMTDYRLIKQIESDTSARVGGTLYSDALSAPAGPAPDYVALIRHNVSQLAGAMQNNPEQPK